MLLRKKEAIGLLYTGGAVGGLEHGLWVGGHGGGGDLLAWMSPCEKQGKAQGCWVLWAVTCQRSLEQG